MSATENVQAGQASKIVWPTPRWDVAVLRYVTQRAVVRVAAASKEKAVLHALQTATLMDNDAQWDTVKGPNGHVGLHAAPDSIRQADPLIHPPRKDWVQALRAMQRAGLRFEDCLKAFGTPLRDSPEIRAAKVSFERNACVTIDDTAVVDHADEDGALVSAWVYVEAEDVAHEAKRHPPAD